jgi:hypothetical protein
MVIALSPMRCLLRLFLPLFGVAGVFAADLALRSPDGRIELAFLLRDDGRPAYTVQRDGRPVLAESRLGLVRDDADFTRGLSLAEVTPVAAVADDYELLTGKRRLNHYRANRRVFHLATAAGRKLDVIFQVSDDGVAFRYHFPENSGTIHTVREEVSSFRLPKDARAWLQPMSPAKSGWMATNPSYEETYARDIPAGTPSRLGAGWIFPALFRTGDTWVLLSETALGRNYCGSRLRHESPDGEYAIGFPDPRETMHDQPVNPSSTLPWTTPWRLIALGDLRTIAESTLGTDLADPAATPAVPAPAPGKAAWSWPQLGDDRTTFEVQRQFVDYAAHMGWAYCLVDALWDKQIGYEKIAELADYARARKVGVLLWYNSNGTANQAPQTPKDRMEDRPARLAEFARLQAMGIRGLKVDFFGGDGQPVIQYYHDLLEDSARFGLLMNFHGTTLPRGWTRTYPHLMTMEAIKGFEFITFDQRNADDEPAHAAMLPFTRNVFEPMDFTPVCLHKLGKTRLRTTPAFELALSVLFVSGIQHYPDTPEGMAMMPEYVQDFMRRVPSVWEDTKFLDGFPGQSVALARRGNGRWFVAGINGEGAPRDLTLDLSRLEGAKGAGRLITDGGEGGFAERAISIADRTLKLKLPANGGFVLELE